MLQRNIIPLYLLISMKFHRHMNTLLLLLLLEHHKSDKKHTKNFFLLH